MIIVILFLQFVVMGALAEGLRFLFSTETKASKKNWKPEIENRKKPYKAGF